MIGFNSALPGIRKKKKKKILSRISLARNKKVFRTEYRNFQLTLPERIRSCCNRTDLLHQGVTIAMRREYILYVLLLLEQRHVRIERKIVPVESKSVLRREVRRVYNVGLLPQMPAIKRNKLISRDEVR